MANMNFLNLGTSTDGDPQKIFFIGVIRALALDNRDKGYHCRYISACRNDSFRVSTLYAFSNEIGIPLSEIAEYVEDGMKGDEITFEYFDKKSSEYITRSAMQRTLPALGVSKTEMAERIYGQGNHVSGITRACKSDITLSFLLEILAKNNLKLSTFFSKFEEEAAKVVKETVNMKMNGDSLKFSLVKAFRNGSRKRK